MQKRRTYSVESLESRLVLSATAAGLHPYIVVLNDDVVNPSDTARNLVPHGQGEVNFVYEHALKGFSAKLPQAAANALSNNPKVKYVEPSGFMHTMATVPTGVARIGASPSDPNAPPDLSAVDIAIIDTGIDVDHPDLNVVGGRYADESGGPPWSRTVTMVDDPSLYNDGNGHGTHVSGTAAASGGIVGVAPGASLWAVKVLEDNGSGSYGQVIAGIDWVAENAATIEVANMSLGGGFSQAVNDAVNNLVSKGVVVVVAAGNESQNVSNVSPASAANAITVSAAYDTDGAPGGSGGSSDDTLASFSNYGSGVDVAAPGVNILSTWPGGAYNTISGTSMASPHVAGAAALLLGADPNASVATIKATLESGEAMADWRPDNLDVASDPDNSHEDMVNVGDNSGGPGGGDAAPSISITSPNPGGDVSGNNVALTANASDDNGVVSVEFFVNDSTQPIVAENDGNGSWTAFWDSTIVADGANDIYAIATDTIDQQTPSTSVTVTVDNIPDGNSTASVVSTASSIKGRSGKWEASATVEVVNGSGTVAGATVDAVWGTDQVVSGVTGNNGRVIFLSGNITTSSVEFQVTSPSSVSITINQDGSTSSTDAPAVAVLATFQPSLGSPYVDSFEKPDGDPPYGAPPLAAPPVAAPPIEFPPAVPVDPPDDVPSGPPNEVPVGPPADTLPDGSPLDSAFADSGFVSGLTAF